MLILDCELFVAMGVPFLFTYLFIYSLEGGKTCINGTGHLLVAICLPLFCCCFIFSCWSDFAEWCHTLKRYFPEVLCPKGHTLVWMFIQEHISQWYFRSHFLDFLNIIVLHHVEWAQWLNYCVFFSGLGRLPNPECAQLIGPYTCMHI